jgi:TRAP-type C4-dicarboxylate transport system permease small subunit
MFLAMTAAGSIILQPKVSGHASVSLNIPKNLYYVPILIVSIYLIFVYLNELIEIIRNRGGCRE